MNQICVHIPPLHTDQTIELVVTINGKKRMMNYRVESVEWPPFESLAERIGRLQDYLLSYEDGWELVQIGTPSPDNLLPVMFRQRVLEAA